MLNRVTFILAAVCTLTLSTLAGCVKTYNPAPKQGEISFGAGSLLLNDDATKSGAGLKTIFDQASENVGEANADKFFVYGTKTISGTRYNVFNGESVSLTSLGSNASDPIDDVWEYSPLRFWDSNASQYDFLAISGPASAGGIVCNPAGSAHIRANVTFDALDSPYDLLAAGYQRNDGSTTPVALEFYHILSAVRVTIINDSPSTSVTVNSYGFRNICIGATGMVEQSGSGLATMGTGNWEPSSYTSSTVLGHRGTTALGNKQEFALPADKWDLMAPQELAPYGDYIPQLMLDYEYDQENPYTLEMEHNHPVFPIRLDEIPVKNSEELITKWLPGKKYIYEIHIRLGGGIIVNVAVTDWKDISAETPGLTINDE